MLQYANNIISRVTPTQWLIYACIALIILLSDTLWNTLNRVAGKNHCVHTSLQDKLALIYVGFILLVTLFIREIGSGGKLAWTPFWSWKMVLQLHNLWLLWQILLNILLFVPLGALLALNRGLSAKVTVLMGFGLSLCIELCQLVFRLGLFEWDDILHNGVGCALGMAVMRICKYIMQRARSWKCGNCELW